MTFSFRVPIWLPSDQRIDWREATLDLSDLDGRKVYLKADLADELSSAERVSLRGDGYGTESEALEDGRAWLDGVSTALVDLLVGHDLRPGGPRSFTSEFALDAARQADPEHQHFGEHTGVFAFATDPAAVFHEMTATGIASKRGVDLQSRAVASRASGIRLSERLQLARDLYGAAMFLSSDEARFVALVTAVESLIVQAMRPDDEVHLLDAFVAQVREATLDEEAKDRLANGLSTLKRHSINSSGRKLAERLGATQYLGRTPPDFWKYAYGLRGRMSHGNLRAATVSQIREASPPMQFFFRDLFLVLAKDRY